MPLSSITLVRFQRGRPALSERLVPADGRGPWRALDRIGGVVQGDEMIKAILVTVREADGGTGEHELQLLEVWAKANAARLSAVAKQVLQVYCEVARAALRHGQQRL